MQGGCMTWEEIQAARGLRRLTILWERGLGARVSKTGEVSWVVQRWEGGRGGKATRKVIGHYPVMTLAQARQVAATGDIHTLRSVVKTYFTIRARPGRYWRELGTRFDKLIAGLGPDRVPSAVTKAEIRALLEAKARNHPAAARTLFDALRPFWKWMLREDIVTNDIFANMQPPRTQDSRNRILLPSEIKDLWTALDKIGYPWQPFYQMLLLTAQRRNEVAEMEWRELDLPKRLWVIPRERTKSNREHLVPLPEEARAILTVMPRLLGGTRYVFTTTGLVPISGFSKIQAQVSNAINIPDWRIHDLRRTAASGMAELGVAPHVIERVLNHAVPGLQGVYNRYSYMKEKQEALQVWAAYLLGLVK